MSNKIFSTIVVAFALVKLALVAWWPFSAHMQRPHDSTLFLEQAVSLLEGNWLGAYSDFTLMKGPITAMWIALINFQGIPLLFAHHVFYIGGSMLTLLAFRRFARNKGYLLFVYLLVLFNPFSMAYGPIASGFREMLHQPVVLTMFALSIILFMDFMQRRTVSVGSAILFGVMLFMFWNNREEGIWLLPYLLMLLGVMIYDIWRNTEQDMKPDVVHLLKICLIPFVIWWGGTLAIAWKNYVEYEVFAVVELKTPQFQRAFGGLLGIEPEEWRSRNLAPHDVLDKLYSLPSGSELDLDGKNNEKRKRIHPYMLPWQFRSAVNQAGYYGQGGEAVLAFYDRLGSDIEAACESGKFTCRDPMFGILPPWRQEYVDKFGKAFAKLFDRAITFHRVGTIDEYYSFGTQEYYESISRLVNGPIRMDKTPHQQPLPEFYLRTVKNKTRMIEKLVGLYQLLVPPLFWLAVLGLISRIVFVFREGGATAMDAVYLGLAGTVFAQLLIFSLLYTTGFSHSVRLFFSFYPVFFLFICVGVCSVSIDLSSMLKLRAGMTSVKK